MMRVSKVIVRGTVYPSDILDADKELTTKEDLIIAKNSFEAVINKINDRIDTNHDFRATGSTVTKSWIEDKGETSLWKMETEITDPSTIVKILKKELNGYSMAGKVTMQHKLERIRLTPEVAGLAHIQDGHGHVALVSVDSNGRVSKGYTAPAEDGHYHEILSGTKTEPADDGHVHTLTFTELS
jgi:hypothetical protein